MVSLLPGKVEFRGSSSPHGCSLPAAQGGWGSGCSPGLVVARPLKGGLGFELLAHPSCGLSAAGKSEA